MENTMPFIVRIRDFFGLKPGQTPQEFLAEVRALSQDDCVWLVDHFNRMGLPTSLPLARAA